MFSIFSFFYIFYFVVQFVFRQGKVLLALKGLNKCKENVDRITRLLQDSCRVESYIASAAVPPNCWCFRPISFFVYAWISFRSPCLRGRHVIRCNDVFHVSSIPFKNCFIIVNCQFKWHDNLVIFYHDKTTAIKSITIFSKTCTRFTWKQKITDRTMLCWNEHCHLWSMLLKNRQWNAVFASNSRFGLYFWKSSIDNTSWFQRSAVGSVLLRSQARHQRDVKIPAHRSTAHCYRPTVDSALQYVSRTYFLAWLFYVFIFFYYLSEICQGVHRLCDSTVRPKTVLQDLKMAYLRSTCSLSCKFITSS